MKKQLLVLSALFIVASTTQCSFYDKMKASAKAKYQSAKTTIQQQLPAVKQMVTENLPAVQEFAKTNIMPTVQNIVEEQVILGDKVKDLVSNAPGGAEAFNKVQEIYMNKMHPDFEKREDGQWVDSTNVVTATE